MLRVFLGDSCGRDKYQTAMCQRDFSYLHLLDCNVDNCCVVKIKRYITDLCVLHDLFQCDMLEDAYSIET